MMHALKEQLKHMADTGGESFAAMIQERLGHDQSSEYIIPLKNMILVMPDLIAQIHVWNNDAAVTAPIKRLHGFLLTYLYEPADFLSMKEYGLFGYLDDAYAVASVYSRTAAQFDEAARRELSRSMDLPKQVPEWMKMVRRVLPDETRKIEQMLDEITEGRSDIFDQMMSQTHQEQ